MTTAPPADIAAAFPPVLGGVLAQLSCVLFRRVMLPGGEIRYPWISDNALDLFGYRPEEMTTNARGALNAIHWADRDDHLLAVRRSADAVSLCHEMFRVVSGTGDTRWFRGASQAYQLADGTIAWDGAWLDVSPWMRAERQFQTVMDHAQDVIVTLDADGRVDWANSAAEQLFGHPLVDLGGMDFAALLTEPCVDEGGGLARGSHEVTVRRRDGGTLPFEMTVSEVRADGRLSLIVIGRDISRRKATESTLEETERRLQTLTANIPGVVFQRALDASGSLSCLYVSEGIEEILGAPPRDVIADHQLFVNALLEEDRDRLLPALSASALTLEPLREEFRVRGTDGRIRWLRGQSRPRSTKAAVVWDGVLLDITEEVEERLRAESAVRSSEERLRQVFDAASLGIAVVGMDGTIQQCNPAFVDMCGGGIDIAATPLFDLIERNHLQTAREMPSWNGSFRFDTTPMLEGVGESRFWRVTGTQFSASPTADTPSLLFLIEDITEQTRAAQERRQLEQALQEGHKLEALGRLAGGVAHELNNMLGPILIGAEMLDRTAPLDQRNKERCTRIIDAAKHGRDIVRNVLAYCRKEQKRCEDLLDLVPLFRQFADLATATLPPTIKVAVAIDPTHARMVGDSTQLQQILLNLANNARDAMDGHGTLTLALDHLPSGTLRARPGEPIDPARAYAEIRVTDSGCGMAEATQARIFDPFFTTKPVGQGTGLGLSVVQGIVSGMNGTITVDSAPGQGTTFRILLPLSEET